MPVVLDKLFWSDSSRLPSNELQQKIVESYPGFVWVATTGTSSSDSNIVKWVANTKSNLIEMAKIQSKALGLCNTSKFLNVLPPTHVANLMAKLRLEVSGASCVDYYDSHESWSASNFRELFNRYEIDHCSLVPTQVFDIVSAELKAPKRAHKILVGGGAITDSLINDARSLGWCILRSYGSSETAAFIAKNSYEDWCNHNYKMRLLEAVRVKLSEDSNLLMIDSAFLFDHYLLVNQTTNSFEVRKIDKVDNYWLTEDIASLDSEYLHVQGRGSRFAKIMGESISLDQEEEFWQRKLGKTVFLTKRSDDRKGETLVLCFEDALAFKEQILSINKSIPGPKRVEEITELPVLLASNGKKLYSQMHEKQKSSEKIRL
jgi:O-succinylbenzoic acid--CoA ligase